MKQDPSKQTYKNCTIYALSWPAHRHRYKDDSDTLSCFCYSILDDSCRQCKLGGQKQRFQLRISPWTQFPTERKVCIFLFSSLFTLIISMSSLFRFYGTNAYWLQMTTDTDMDLTFHDIATTGLKVVRTWAFNDVARKPLSGPYFQVMFEYKPVLCYSYPVKILDPTNTTINEGADGLQRLDKLVATANKYGIKVLLSLTNNWNPERPEASGSWSRRDNAELPRGFLSNDYGS